MLTTWARELRLARVWWVHAGVCMCVPRLMTCAWLCVRADPWATAGLLSLRGVNAIVLNQWSTDAATNHAAAMAVVSAGLLSGESVGKAYAGASCQLVAKWQRLQSEAAEARLAHEQMQQQRQQALELQAAREAAREAAGAAEGGEGDDGEEVDAEARAEDEEEVPSEEDVEGEKKKVEELEGEIEATEDAMRGIEGALVLALYGVCAH